jgi:hypothetical protein
MKVGIGNKKDPAVSFLGIKKLDFWYSVGKSEWWLVAATLQCHTKRKKSKRMERQVATPVWLRLLIRGWNKIQ